MEINMQKLHEELQDAGIPIEGVRGDGTIDFVKGAKKKDRERAQEILEKHDPVDVSAEKRDAYRGAYSHDEFMEAYFELHHEDKPEKMMKIQAKRVLVKNKYVKKGA